MTDPTTVPGASGLEPGGLAWRIMLARAAHSFFNPAHPLHAEYATLIGKPVQGALDAWNVNDFINLVLRRGLQPGDATLIPRILAAMERAGLLIEFGWEQGLSVFGRRYETMANYRPR